MERIILGEIPTDPASKRFEPAPSDQPDIAIEIKRRA
jgi:hypothetical protein